MVCFSVFYDVPYIFDTLTYEIANHYNTALCSSDRTCIYFRKNWKWFFPPKFYLNHHFAYFQAFDMVKNNLFIFIETLSLKA